VIDPATRTLYVVAKTKEPTNYFQRLHALDLATATKNLAAREHFFRAYGPGHRGHG